MSVPRTHRVLVVEDDSAIHLLVKRVLEREGFVVEGVPNGDAAIRKLREVEYDLLILDLILPEVSGEQVLDFLDEAQPNHIRRVIVTTASPRLLSNAFLKRVCHVLTKPFDIEQLIQLARECSHDGAAIPSSGCPFDNDRRLAK